jgi:hypothetical protein
LKIQQDIEITEGQDAVHEALFHTTLVLDQQAVMHERYIYNFFDLMGDLGGVKEVIMICFAIFLLPVSEHSFILKATKKLYMANTTDAHLFMACKGAATNTQTTTKMQTINTMNDSQNRLNNSITQDMMKN